ncbi:hypothetical protein ACQP2P_16120 [Dactylosporangium sp. CA-139114]|uniref:hypothetical protein n=1 Tax=Dactylosporangium sp. CA-139114 TaxID=3239931 RepID=UPI003D96FE09
MGVVGAWETRDRRWRVEVGGVGAIAWYRLIGPDGDARNLPSLSALSAALGAAGLDLAELREAHGVDTAA